MIHHRKASRVSGAVFAALTLILSQGIALAQPPGGPPPGGPGGPGGPPPGGPGGPGGPRGRGMSAVNVPAAALAADLKLTTTQQEKIDKIQKQFQQDRSKLMPARPEQGADPTDQGGAPPDPETMRANFEKLSSLERQASKQIDTVLTADQKKALPIALKNIQSLRMAGIPAEVLGDLKLTADQKKQIASVVEKSQQSMRQKMEDARQSGDFENMRAVMTESREAMHNAAMAKLTADQKTIVEDYLKDHPQQEFEPGGGPPGGFGPPPGGGGPGGAPPPPPDGDNTL